jgi:GNAT superfamily N-acetyltransferase
MSIGIQIRHATKEDTPTLIDLQKNDGFSHQYYLTQERLDRLFGRGEVFFLATLDGEPVGFASADCEVRAKVHFLSVDLKFQRRGIGSMLMKSIIKEVKNKGHNRLNCYIETDSTLDVFLQKQGFVQVGYYKNRFGSGKDASIWEKYFESKE